MSRPPFDATGLWAACPGSVITLRGPALSARDETRTAVSPDSEPYEDPAIGQPVDMKPALHTATKCHLVGLSERPR